MSEAAARWYVTKTKARAERIAEQNLERQGYRVFLPEIRVERHRRGRWQDSLQPLFPGYLFVQLEASRQDFSPIRSTRGVLALVRFTSLPEPMPRGSVESLIQRLQQDPEQVPVESPLLRGTPVQVVQGAFTGWQGVFQAETADQRVTILLDMLGRERTLAFSRDAVVPA